MAHALWSRRVNAALLALAFVAGLLLLPAAAPHAKAAPLDEASGAILLSAPDGAVPDAANASDKDSAESRLDAAERTVALRLRRETNPTARRDEPRPAPTPTGRTTERAVTVGSADEPG